MAAIISPGRWARRSSFGNRASASSYIACARSVWNRIDATFEFPRYYGGEVIVTLDDGRTLSERVAVNRGHPERPLTDEEIQAKFFENCALTLDANRCDQHTDGFVAPL